VTLLVRHTDVLGGYDPAARGGGIIGGWNPLNQFRGWRTYTIEDVYTDPDGIEFPALRIVKASGPPTDTIKQNIARTQRYFADRTWRFEDGGGNRITDIRGSFPDLAWYFMDPATLAFVAGPLLPLGNSQANPLSFFDPAVLDTTLQTEHYVQWFENTPPTGPYIGVQVAREPSETFPSNPFQPGRAPAFRRTARDLR
jgi:hypothetical protein